MEILEKDSNKVKIETETDNYKENFDFELTWKNEVDIEIDNILNDYNLAKTLVVKVKEPKQTYKKQSIHELFADYANIIYNNMKELAKTNIIQYTIHLLNSIPITQGCHLMDQKDRNWLKKELDELLEKGIIRESITFELSQ